MQFWFALHVFFYILHMDICIWAQGLDDNHLTEVSEWQGNIFPLLDNSCAGLGR